MIPISPKNFKIFQLKNDFPHLRIWVAPTHFQNSRKKIEIEFSREQNSELKQNVVPWKIRFWIFLDFEIALVAPKCVGVENRLSVSMTYWTRFEFLKQVFMGFHGFSWVFMGFWKLTEFDFVMTHRLEPWSNGQWWLISRERILITTPELSESTQ